MQHYYNTSHTKTNKAKQSKKQTQADKHKQSTAKPTNSYTKPNKQLM